MVSKAADKSNSISPVTFPVSNVYSYVVVNFQ